MPIKNGFSASLMMLLHITLKRSNVSLTKNGDVDGTCKRAFIRTVSQVLKTLLYSEAKSANMVQYCCVFFGYKCLSLPEKI